jgi:hypothetical protein
MAVTHTVLHIYSVLAMRQTILKILEGKATCRLYRKSSDECTSASYCTVVFSSFGRTLLRLRILYEDDMLPFFLRTLLFFGLRL